MFSRVALATILLMTSTAKAAAPPQMLSVLDDK
jgi:hypothetical protein